MSAAGGRPTQSGEDPSPCVSICTLDATGTLCVGCFRTVDEIAAWSVLDAGAKRAVCAALPLRRAANDREPPVTRS
jgi:hypothetical protein